MSVVIALVAGVAGLALLATLLLRVDAASLARSIRLAGPLALGIVGAILMFAGRAAFGGMLLSGAAAWYGAGQRRQKAKPTPGRRSSVRTAALEMELDHDTGALEGQVLAGTYEGHMLGTLDLQALTELMHELRSDSESVRLLETYLDGRFPTWREHMQADMDAGAGSAPAAGPMSKEEAYKILGLEATATAADIRQAHRRLMQRLHPDLGGSTFLAARINEAKDVLLSHHN
jgi:hypothetical protein